MSDEEDVEGFEEIEESDKDFSASEDEWKPDQTVIDSDSNDDTFQEQPPRKNKKMSLNISYKPQKRERNGRISLLVNTTKHHTPLSRTATISKFTNKRNTKNEDSDSRSSGDDCLVHPDKIDFQSSFFNRNTSGSNNVKNEPVFECDGGMNLTDSEEDDEMENVDCEKSSQNSFKNFFEYNEIVEQAKEQRKQFELNRTVEENVDISSLLAMGESSKPATIAKNNPTKKLKKAKKNFEHSDSDWEEVEDQQVLETAVNDGDLQVTVALMPTKERQVKKITDEQASLMRQLNRVIKENHVMAHKVSLLCHIAHGIYLNRALNNVNLLGQALKLLPNKNCYPDGRTEIKYFESITKWYKSVMKLKSNDMYSTLKKRPEIPQSLALQIKYKEAICKKDYILIFIVLLRAMGIQCRLVMNLVPLPLRPAQSDLCTIKITKQINDQEKKKTLNKNTSVKVVKKEENSKENIKKSVININEKCVAKNIKTSPKKTRSQTKTSERKIEKEKNSTAVSKDNQPSSLKKKIEVPATSSKTIMSTATKSKSKSHENIIPPKTTTSLKSSQKPPASPMDGNIPDIKIIKTAISKADKGKPVNKKSNSSNKNMREKNRSPSPKFHISPLFTQSNPNIEESTNKKLSTKKKPSSRKTRRKSNSPTTKIHISPLFTQTKSNIIDSNETNKKIGPRTRGAIKNTLSVPQMDGGNDEPKIKTKSLSEKLQKERFKRKSSNEDSDFEISPPKKSKPSTSKKPENKSINEKKRDRRVLSTDYEESPKKKQNPVDIWIEVYCEMEEKWITIELFKGKVHCVDSIRKQATSPMAYIFAWNNDNTLKDVSPRYCPQWNTVTRKMRIEKEWLDEAIRSYRGKKNVRDKAEDLELDKIHLDKPLPQTISEYKNHPLYALKRHLLKFQGIYPPNAVTLGFVRGEPVYSRDCVHTLHSREIWLKSARVVKPKQEPYKIVKARPKWDKVNSKVIKDLPLEIFGYWQTMEYEPPTAENGIVPRNAYGNVELFKACMLPKKTVHLTLPGLNRVCKKLQIDCAPAVIGFDFHQGSCHPLLDGFVVCEEFGDQVVEAWHKYQEEMERREEEKYQQRVYGNWKKLIKGLLIRQRLKIKYNFDGGEGPSETSKKQKKN